MIDHEKLVFDIDKFHSDFKDGPPNYVSKDMWNHILHLLDQSSRAITELMEENVKFVSPDTMRINKLESVNQRVEEHGGIYHLVALDEAAMENRLIILPDMFYVGQHIWVIESSYRTGNPTAVVRNTVKGFDHAGIYYRYDSATPVYHELWEDFNKTFFVDRDMADRVFKEKYK